MTVTFRRVGRVCTWEALRPPRTRVPGPSMAPGADLPHDLATFVIEQALGIDDGFWGCVAKGATFRTLGRRRTPQGKAVIAEHATALDAAEHRVNATYFAWRAGERVACQVQLDDMLERWRNVGDDGLVVTWPVG